MLTSFLSKCVAATLLCAAPEAQFESHSQCLRAAEAKQVVSRRLNEPAYHTCTKGLYSPFVPMVRAYSMPVKPAPKVIVAKKASKDSKKK